jgi:hypothetical protein
VALKAVGCEMRRQALCGAQKGYHGTSGRSFIGVEDEDLGNKAWWIERGEKREILGYFVLENSEKSDVGVDVRLEGDIIKSGS